MKTKKLPQIAAPLVVHTDLREALESLAERTYSSEKLLLEVIEQLGLKAEILGKDARRVCYILRPYKVNDPEGQYYPCYEMNLTGEGRGKVNTGIGWWW
ncbi:MAG: hypothetical protein JWP00_2269 [Chloroflexi bacterium]|jgi:hypothetical protein|nr:hypothetical protein [Chloroflexota bacterium]